MKKIIVFGILLLGAKSVFAQTSETGSAPAAVKTAFSIAHPGAVGKWEKEGANYEVNFKENGKIMSCVVDKSGTILETETDIKVSALPASVQTYVTQHYKGAAIKEAAHIVKASGETMYEAEVAGKDLMFSQDGKFIKTDKE